MVITITGNVYSAELTLFCKDRRFYEKFGDVRYADLGINCNRKYLFDEMVRIATWCNNDLGEECSFETA